ncbi:MAG: N-acetylmuramoyl-L-alanine amidase [Bacteroidetes bacterium]|nr:N-acetylmuramoyl-L-alanine amidase [Bacteroidota bacterium]
MNLVLSAILNLLLITGQSHSARPAPCTGVKIVNHIVNWGQRKMEHPRKIEAIIIHSSYNALDADSFSVKGILREYKDAGVTPHYIIDRSGTIFRLAPDNNVAYQAGKSRLPDGKTDVNSVSLGIEIVNTMHDSPTKAQYVSLVKLVRCLESKYPVKYVLGHKDIAPGRKTDPWNFDWAKFHSMLEQE